MNLVIIRGLFWIVAVAFLVSGNRNFTYEVEGEEMLLFENAGAVVETSDRVVESVSKLHGFCDRNGAVCEAAVAVGDMALRVVNIVVGEAHIWLEEKASDAAPLEDDYLSEFEAEFGSQD